MFNGINKATRILLMIVLVATFLFTRYYFYDMKIQTVLIIASICAILIMIEVKFGEEDKRGCLKIDD